MITSALMTASVTLNRRVQTGVDAYNKPIVTLSPTVVKAYYAPRRTNTVVDGGDILKTDFKVIVQPFTDLDALESVIVEGNTYEVDGIPVPHWNPLTSRVEYITIYLREGAS